MWLLAEDSHEISSYFLWKQCKKYSRLSSAPVVICSLRVKIFLDDVFKWEIAIAKQNAENSPEVISERMV